MEMSKLLTMAMARHASDLLLVPGSPPMLRIDGSLVALEVPPLAADACQDILHSILSERQIEKLETTRELDTSHSLPGVGRFRVNLHWQRGGLAGAIRLAGEQIPTLENLGLPPIVAELTLREKGLLLVTGPTGSGKSSTLVAMVQHLNENVRRHIITIEDPIEYLFRNKQSLVEQREVGLDTLSFSTALWHALRQAPDVVMLGEMRDQETMAAALTAAETGHLVLATLHTTGAAQTLDRIVDAFSPAAQSQVRLQLSVSLIAVISQQLLPKIGGGRVVALEVLLANPAVRNLIRKGESGQVQNALSTGAAEGMISMAHSVSQLYSKGLIDQDTMAAKGERAERVLA